MPLFSLSSANLLIYAVTLVVGITLHEFAHAKVADLFGDTTPRMNGRVTLNPLSHLDPVGSLLMIIGGFGWGRPVPVNPYALSRRSPAALMWVSLAGPGANLFLAMIAAVPLRLGLASAVPLGPTLPSPLQFLSGFIFTNVFLALFNLVPLAPLDGEKIASTLLPPGPAHILDAIRPYGAMILILLLFVSPMLGFDFMGKVVYPPVARLAALITGTL